ncbi:MAG TPA: hypothetical protein VIO61_01065 [Anaerolineaceae bacterium]
MSAAVPFVQRSLFHYLLKLLRLRMSITWSTFRRSKTRQKVSYTILALLFIALAGFLFWISSTVLVALQSPSVKEYIDVSAVVHSLPSMMVSAAFVVFLMTNFGVLLQGLYLARDMDFLMSAPLPMRAVFLSKLVIAILPNFGLICLFTLPLLFGIGTSYSYSFLYYPAVVIVLTAFSLTGAGMAGVLVMAVVRVIPARRVAEVLGFLGALVSVLLSQSGNIASQMGVSGETLAGGLNRLTVLNTPFSPLAWAGRGLTSLGEGNSLAGAAWLGASISTAVIVFWLTLNLAERLYYSGWARMQGSPQRRKNGRAVPVSAGSAAVPAASAAAQQAVLTSVAPGWLERIFSPLPPKMRAVVIKDLRLIPRDIRNMSQLITPIVISFVYIFSIARSFANIQAVSNDFPQRMFELGWGYLNVPVVLFVGWSFVINLSMSAFSREGRAYWLIKTAPIPATTLLKAKYLVSILPSVLLQWLLLLLISAFQWKGVASLIYGLAATAFWTAGAIGINLAFGVVGAKLDWDDPRRMNRSGTGCLGALAGFVYLGIGAILYFVPPAGALALGLPESLGHAVGLILGGITSALCAILPLRKVLKRVDKIGLD